MAFDRLLQNFGEGVIPGRSEAKGKGIQLFLRERVELSARWIPIPAPWAAGDDTGSLFQKPVKSFRKQDDLPALKMAIETMKDTFKA